MSPIISVENLGKCYRIHHEKQERYTALRDVIARKVRGIFHPASSIQHPASSDEDFWALKDVSFEVNQGEVVGIIGRNGAGKSTLLKILSRITEPTKGRITLRGRVASLLEVGTGFHPELTGRENIFLNGAILGMTRAEIRSKFDEIVAFAEIEKFIDTPVKRYSSGMYVRLAFAVAAHLEPEILIVDEVLAVGDVQFQNKCLGKMQDVSRREGRTVLFVSHNLSTVQNLCKKVLTMSNGSVAFQGDSEAGIQVYLKSGRPDESRDSGGWIRLESKIPTGNGSVVFKGLRICSTSGEPISHLAVGQSCSVEIEFDMTKTVKGLTVGAGFHDQMEEALFATHWNDFGQVYDLHVGRWRTSCFLSPNYLRAGRYSISLGAITPGELCAHLTNAASFTIEPALSNEITHYDQRIGRIFIPMKWSAPQPC
jgi:lipopolysaccharide transport system ATP-binding protein